MINVKKTKVMGVNQKEIISWKFMLMGKFRYLGREWILHNRHLEQNWHGDDSVYGEKKLNLELKKRVMNVVVYAAETRTLTQTDRQKIRSLQNVDMEKNGKDKLAW